MNFWIELSIILILGYFNVYLALVLDVCWLFTRLFWNSKEDRIYVVVHRILDILEKDEEFDGS